MPDGRLYRDRMLIHAGNLFSDAARQFADRAALEDGTSYRELDSAVSRVASGLASLGINAGERVGVLRIPRGAILTFDPITHAGVVFVVANGKAERRNMTIGISSGEEVEIVTGLGAGDTVVSRGAFNLRDGDRVAVVSGATGA